MLSRLPSCVERSSHEPCRLVAGDAIEEPTIASQSLTSTAGLQRLEQWKPSFLATVASAHTSKGISQRTRRAETDTPWSRASVR